MFRDMSGLSETVKLPLEAPQGFIGRRDPSVGAQASKNMEVAVTADTERQRIKADLAKALAGKLLGDKSEIRQGRRSQRGRQAEGRGGGRHPQRRELRRAPVAASLRRRRGGQRWRDAGGSGGSGTPSPVSGGGPGKAEHARSSRPAVDRERRPRPDRRQRRSRPHALSV